MDGRGEKRDGSEEERGEYFIAQVDVFASFRLSRTIRSLAHCVHLAANEEVLAGSRRVGDNG